MSVGIPLAVIFGAPHFFWEGYPDYYKYAGMLGIIFLIGAAWIKFKEKKGKPPD
jgi:hypothetical protein